MESALRAKVAGGYGARIAAGYCWPWSDPRSDKTLVPDVQIGSWARPWNLKGDRKVGDAPPAALWATDPNGFDQVTITIPVFITADGGTLDNQACVDPNDTIVESHEDNNCSTNVTPVTHKAPDLLINKSVDKTSVTPGDQITYTLTISNNGDADAGLPHPDGHEAPDPGGNARYARVSRRGVEDEGPSVALVEPHVAPGPVDVQAVEGLLDAGQIADHERVEQERHARRGEALGPDVHPPMCGVDALVEAQREAAEHDEDDGDAGQPEQNGLELELHWPICLYTRRTPS
jgi:hypothetical protein